MSKKNKFDYSVTFACYNEVEYTKKCIDSMMHNKDDLSRLVIVDNSSSDDTQEYLQTLSVGGVILNKSNLGCGVAWNQGVMEFQSEWSIIMNNDIVVSNDWINGLISSAIDNNVRVISPALMEGEFDYDFESAVLDAKKQMNGYVRFGDQHAVCLAVHNSVWNEIGYFRASPSLLGYEDTLFFHELKNKGIKTATTSSSWLYHFGSVTQSYMRKEQGLQDKDSLAARNNHRFLQQSWIGRKLSKIKKNRFRKKLRAYEIDKFGMTLHGVRDNNKFYWK